MLTPWYERAINASVHLEYVRHDGDDGSWRYELNAVGTGALIDLNYAVLIGSGSPIHGSYILDEHLEPVPIGVAGELYIGGAGVARGYLNRPELTAERFIASPFVAGDRLYKTGDVARYLADGNIEYLGRNDFQVKIRGFRIELGEIESALLQYAGIRDAVVVACDDRGEKRLVAYYTAADASLNEAESLRTHLQNRLPEYMVPAAYVHLDVLPLTANGKVDRKALPAPDDTAYASREYAAPQGAVEEAIAQIWSELLGVDRVGRNDNFFELGGHSLLVVRVIDRMRTAGLHADVRTLFTAPTLVDLAVVVSEQREVRVEIPPNRIPSESSTITPEMLPLVELTAEQIDRIVAGVPGGARNIQDIYPLAPLQEGILFHHLLEGKGDPYLLHAVYRFASRDRVDAYLAALQAVIDRHDILRTSFVWEGLPEAAQVVWRTAVLSVEEVVLDAADGEIAQQLFSRFDPRHYRLDVRRAPLMQMALAQEPSGSWVLMHLFHHLVLDLTALQVVQHEIGEHLRGEADQLPEPVPFRTLVAQARLGVSRADHEAFFRAMLGDVGEPTLPYGLADVQGDGSEIREAYYSVESSLTKRLRERARRLSVSAASICHVAWARVLSALSGRDDVVFGTVLFGRMQGGAGAARAMGLFLNTLPMRVKVDATSAEAGVRQMHKTLADLMHHEHASLALAQRCSGVVAPVPLFSALLNYRHISMESVTRELDGIEALAGGERTNYPVTLSINDFGEELSFSAQVHGSVDATRTCSYMHQALEELVEALERAPETALKALRVLPESERQQLVVEWNATEAPYPADRCVHELFEEQVARTPDAVALVHEDTQLTYGELNARANRLAHYLRECGVMPDTRVALCMERSIELVVSLLAVLKAGGAYVPLDPSYPLDRLEYMLVDSAPAVVLTHGAVAAAVQAVLGLVGVPVVEVDEHAGRWADASALNPVRRELTPAHLACIIYRTGFGGELEGLIGRPTSNTRTYVLDERLEPVPIGVVGEWYVAGAGVALGYWGRPELTAEHFLSSPFVSGDRLYKTDDMARYLPDGNVELIGRKKSTSATDLLNATHLYEAPQGMLEETIAQIWSALLDVERVGRHDNFFELGGHSLLVMRAIERMRTAGLHADVRTLFTASTLVDLAAAVSQKDDTDSELPPNLISDVASSITPQMLSLVELSAKQIASIAASVPGRERNIQDIYPLAPLQEGMLFHHLLADKGDPYLAYRVLRFGSRERVDAYLAALQAVIDRHDILRTSFVWEGLPEAAQVVWRTAPLSVEEVVLDAADGEIAQQLFSRFDPRHYRLDVRRAPLMHAALAHDSHDGSWVLVHLSHQLTLDHTAFSVVHREIDAHLRGEIGHLPEPVPFRTLVAQARLGVSRAEHETFFRAMLGDVGEPTLPYGLADVQGDGSEIREAYYPVESSLTKRLRDRARRLGVSAASICHVAWARVLSALSGRDDVVFGTVVFGRMQGGAGTERAVGLFSNTLPVRVKVDATSAEAGVRQMHKTLADLMHHEHASLALAQRCSGVVAPVPLFSAVLNYRHAVVVSTGRPVDGIRMLAEEERTNLPLMFAVDDFGEELSFSAQVHGSVDATRTCSYMHQALEELVKALERAPETALKALRVLPESERQQLVVEWNATEAPYPADRCVHELFEEQVARTPDAVALVHEDTQLTYGELNARANRLAHYLRECGVMPDTRVALCMERSIELVVSLLAVLKAGGAYVPLDPSYPLDRLEYMLVDSAPAVVLTHGAVAAAVQAVLGLVGAPVVEVDEHAGRWADASALNPVRRELTPAHLAYIIYTSGSTGRPKGVMVEHANVARLFEATRDWFQFDASDVWTLFHSCAFDFSVWEIWGALLHGGRLVIVSHMMSRSPSDFYELLCESGVTVLNQTPSAFRALIGAQAQSESSHCLRHVIFGGEALDTTMLTPWYERAINASVHLTNMYGITETTVHVTHHELTPEGYDRKDGCSLIGSRIRDLRTYILGEDLAPVPIGVAGELYIGGAGVARGYLNRPELTAERFIASPFVAGDRLYKTGDVARYLADGNIEYLGRNDFQVKIRGFRIELGEIESALLQYAGIRDAVVVADQKASVGTSLIGYVVPDAEKLKASSLLSGVRLDAIQHWESLYDYQYELAESKEPSFIGWNSSYTDEPIPLEQMQEWLRATCSRIKALSPKHLLEIGCGVGLILKEVAPYCQRYVGIDVSSRAIADLRAWVKTQSYLYDIELLHGDARELSTLTGEFDTVVINSVAQYFPDVDYLVNVLDGAVKLLRGGGRIFIGDVRNLALERAFHSSLEVARVESTTNIGQLRVRIDRAVQNDKELLLDPRFFWALQERLDIGSVEILLKRGQSNNELTNYRYDVVLHIGQVCTARTPFLEFASTTSWSRLEDALLKRAPLVRLKGVRNRRVVDDVKLLQLIEGSDGRGTLLELRAQSDAGAGTSPEAFWSLGDSYGYETRVSWTLDSEEGAFDVVFIDRDQVRGEPTAATSELEPYNAYASDPMIRRLRSELPAALREHMQSMLPEYMVPRALVLMDQFPLTPNGKIDRKGLPAAGDSAYATGAYEAPTNETERTLAQIWSDLLGVARVGRHDNLFALGGHSLLLVRAVNRIKNTGLDVRVGELFKFPTIASLLQHLRQRGVDASMSKSLVPVRKIGSRLPLFLMHEVSGEEVYFSMLGPHLEENLPVYGLAGIPLDDPQTSEMHALAARLIPLMRSVQPTGPYRVAGWSFGGFLAYEVAQQLMAVGESVEFVGLLDTYLSEAGRHEDNRILDNYTPKQMLCEFFRFSSTDKEIIESINLVEKRSDQVGFAELMKQLLQICELPHIFRVYDMENIERSCLRQIAHHKAMATYVAQPISTRIHIFCAEEAAGKLDESLGWGAVLPRELLCTSRVPGTHWSMMDIYVRELGQAISRALKEIDGYDRDAEAVDKVLNLV